MEWADMADLKSVEVKTSCGFESRLPHSIKNLNLERSLFEVSVFFYCNIVKYKGSVAQQVQHLTCNRVFVGSNPAGAFQEVDTMKKATPNDEFAEEVLRMAEQNPQDEPTTTYDPDGNCIEFFVKQEPFYAERVNDLVTIYYSQETDEIIGSLIKF